MSAQLDTEVVTRAMLAAAAPKPPRRYWTAGEDAVLRAYYRRRKGLALCAARTGRTEDAVDNRAQLLGLRRKARWTAAELDVLRREWGDCGERALRRKLPGRTWDGIVQQAAKLNLGCPSQGRVSMEAAADHIGLHHTTLRRILGLAGVVVLRHVRGSTLNARNRGRYCWQRIDLDRAVEAVEAYDRGRAVTHSCAAAAEHCGVDHTTMRWALQMLAATRPVDGINAGRAWAVSREDAEAAIALYRVRKAEAHAARRAARAA